MLEALKILKPDGAEGILSGEAVEGLMRGTRGEVITPSDPAYEQARALWNGMIDRRPALIVKCSGVADVMTSVKFVREHGLRISVKGGGHNVAGNAMCDGGLVIDLSKMRGVRVDAARRTARVQGGATLGDLDHEAQAFGLAAPIGVVSATGIAGLTLHGGIGWLLRKHGLAADNLLSADIVTADGAVRRASAEENSDLLWALRGGGGNFGVVTSFEFQLHPVGPMVWMGLPVYPLEKATEVLQAFRAHMATAPDELMTLAVFWSAPPIPEVPKEIHGQPVLIIGACYSGPLDKGEQAVAPLRNFAQPLADLSGPMPYLAAQRFFDADYPNGRRYYWKSTFVHALTDEIIDVVIAAGRNRPTPISAVEVWSFGGAFGRVDPQESCFGNRDAPFLVGVEANFENSRDDQANIAWARRVLEDIQSHSPARAYLNFAGFAEEGEAMMKASFGASYQRLQAVKAKYDPGNLFRSTFNIRPPA